MLPHSMHIHIKYMNRLYCNTWVIRNLQVPVGHTCGHVQHNNYIYI